MVVPAPTVAPVRTAAADRTLMVVVQTAAAGGDVAAAVDVAVVVVVVEVEVLRSSGATEQTGQEASAAVERTAVGCRLVEEGRRIVATAEESESTKRTIVASVAGAEGELVEVERIVAVEERTAEVAEQTAVVVLRSSAEVVERNQTLVASAGVGLKNLISE